MIVSIRKHKFLFIVMVLEFTGDLFFDVLEHCDFLKSAALDSHFLAGNLDSQDLRNEETRKSAPAPSVPYHEENCCPCICHVVKVVFNECLWRIYTVETQKIITDIFQIFEGIPPQVFQPPIV